METVKGKNKAKTNQKKKKEEAVKLLLSTKSSLESYI